MPAVEPNHGREKVLVTGANGYIATWLIRTLLEQGYAVRGTVRSVEKGEHLQEQFSSWRERFEWVIVPDITTVRPRFLSLSPVLFISSRKERSTKL